MNPTDALITQVRAYIAQQDAALLPTFDVMAQEARFARDWLDEDLHALPSGATILEVGGGIFLLSVLLARMGFHVTTIEPIGEGFGEFAAIQQQVLAYAATQPIALTKIDAKVEDYHASNAFDFACSVNVMEHVDDVKAAIVNVVAALKPQGSYRFFCPNYRFPYEPHFNIPIVWDKEVTQFLFHARIHNHPMPDPIGAWYSLNWITVATVARIVRAMPHARLQCRRDITSRLLVRAVTDEAFAARRSKLLVRAIRILTALRLHRLANLLPATLQPAMDCRITRG